MCLERKVNMWVHKQSCIDRLKEIRMFTPSELMRSKMEDPLMILDKKLRDYIKELEEQKE